LTSTTANSSLLSAVNCEMSRRKSSLIPELDQDGLRKTYIKRKTELRKEKKGSLNKFKFEKIS